MQVYYLEDFNSYPLILDREESHHVIHVLRHRKGDSIHITDGKGKKAIAIISIPDPKGCIIEITEVLTSEKKQTYKLHIAVAPTKNIDRLEWFIEKAVEIGIDEITPILTARSERKVVNAERLNKLMLSAAKQSMKYTFPRLNVLTNFNDFIISTNSDHNFIAMCTAGLPLLKNTYLKGNSSIILIGPEGDFEEKEATIAIENNFKPISLGENRLRTETAALVACHSVAFMNQ
jgi:16S rRNA (uracil1498-N3)-methyltransferase